MNLPKQIPVNENIDSAPTASEPESLEVLPALRKFAASVEPGRTEYRVFHNLGTLDVIVQTRIAGRVREGGISILDENSILLTFGGVLNERMDIVVIG